MDPHKICQLCEVKWKNVLGPKKAKKKKTGKVVGEYVFTPFTMKPLNKIWYNQLPSEVTELVK